jgi:23S rRNA (pseudouridine1915-N3)-methyltransferase
MSRDLIILWAGRHRRSEWEQLYSRYRERLGRHLDVQERSIKVRAGLEDKRRLDEEGRAILKALPDPSWAVALDRRGASRTSSQVATWFDRLRSDWPHPIVMVIGSDLGLAPEVLERCRERWSFGPLTLPHELARLVLYEQIYRALSIVAGIKYHRQPL